MNDTRQNVAEVFSQIENCIDLAILKDIKLDFIEKKFLFNEDKYPPLGFTISHEEAKKLNTKKT